MSGRWVSTGPGRSVWRPDGADWVIGPDALEPYVNQAGLAVARQIGERWQREVWPRIYAAGGRGRSQGDRRQVAAEVFGDPLPVGHVYEPAPVPDDRPKIWDRMLVPSSDFDAMARGSLTFGFWYGGNVPARSEVVVYVEHVAYRKPSPFGPSVAFLLGDIAAIDWAHGRPNKHVASLLPLPGIVRAPDYAGTPWGFWCALCGAWPAPSPCYRFADQSAALMAADEAGFSVTLAGVTCRSCLVGADDVRRARIGYELKEVAGGTG